MKRGVRFVRPKLVRLNPGSTGYWKMVAFSQIQDPKSFDVSPDTHSRPLKTKPGPKASALERTFAFYWDALGGPELVTEYEFHPIRKWRFDFAHVPSKVAIEVEGGHWSGGRHTRGAGFEEDCSKYNEAALQGWTVFRLTGLMVKKAGIIEGIAGFIARKTPPTKVVDGDSVTARLLA